MTKHDQFCLELSEQIVGNPPAVGKRAIKSFAKSNGVQAHALWRAKAVREYYIDVLGWDFEALLPYSLAHLYERVRRGATRVSWADIAPEYVVKNLAKNLEATKNLSIIELRQFLEKELDGALATTFYVNKKIRFTSSEWAAIQKAYQFFPEEKPGSRRESARLMGRLLGKIAMTLIGRGV